MYALSDKLAAGVGADGEREDAPVYFRKLALGAHVHPDGRGGEMLGVQQNDIVTSSYSYYPVYNYDTDTPTIKGYQANHTLCITCNDVEMLDSVVGAVTDSGMSDIYSVSYDVSNRSDLYKQALELAIDAAAKKADVMANAAGMRITGLESITENNSYDTSYGINSMSDGGAVSTRAESVETGIRSGSISVTASVTAVYEAEVK